MPSQAAKKRRLKKVEAECATRRSGQERFAMLPLEMIFEILSFLPIADLLSLTRSCSFFARLLTNNPSTQFVWRDARKRYRPRPIPDPAPNWTEVSYAAFLFGPARCEICGSAATPIPFSCSLRTRLCDSTRCSNTWFKSLLLDPHRFANLADRPHAAAVQTWLPYYEEESIVNNGHLYSRIDWERAIHRHRDSTRHHQSYAEIQQEFAAKAKLLPRIMEEANKLHTWCRAVRAIRIALHRSNVDFLQAKAGEENWHYEDFRNTPSYLQLIREKDEVGSIITEDEYQELKHKFKEQLTHRLKLRVEAAVDESARQNREDLRRYWTKLKSWRQGSFPINGLLPCYGEFRRLDISKVLLQKNTDKSQAMRDDRERLWVELNSNVDTQSHIRDQVNAWLDDKRAKLATKLGCKHPELETAGGFLHPVERINAWFICTNCSQKNRKALSFKDVCGHQCSTPTRKDRLKAHWDINWFEPDMKAIAAMRQAIRLMSLDERNATMDDANSVSGVHLCCTSCPRTIELNVNRVMSHSKRHDSMVVGILTLFYFIQANFHPVVGGMVDRLNSLERSARKERKEHAFGCKHCDSASKMTFDGLVSHLKTKHGVDSPGDEDVWKVIARPIPNI